MTPSAPPPSDDLKPNSNDSIRRYFERLTLLETIYEKLNMESNKTPVESNGSQPNYSPEKQNPENVLNRQPISTANKTGKIFINEIHHSSSNGFF